MLNVPNIINGWPQIAPLLEPALALAKTHTADDVRKSSLVLASHICAQVKDKIEAVCVTEFVNYPQGLWLRIWLMGALKGVNVLWDKFEETVIGFAAENNCAGIEHWGRKGWTRRYPGTDTETRIYRYKFGERS